MKQGTDEWHQQRLGKVTASRIIDIMAKTKSGYGAARKNYMAQLICERLTGHWEDFFKSPPMQRGNELEPKARAVYFIETGLDVVEVGMIDHSSIMMSGASPDGLVGADGLVEIKCPNTATHLDFLQTMKPKQDYIYQMQWQMACTGRQWCDFVSYDDRLPEWLAYRSLRIQRDDELIKEIEYEVVIFLAELDKTVANLDQFRPQTQQTQQTQQIQLQPSPPIIVAEPYEELLL